MKRILINTSTKYDVLIGNGLLKQAGNQIAQVCTPEKIAIISDTNVFPLYGDTLTASLREHGFSIFHFIFPAGENSKTAATYLEILSFLAENKFTRTDCLIALGGGVVGDITGFAAATFLRGLPYIQIPTSLLAMVDSSVGGKTAIDLPSGKNLVGAFYQPRLVLCDTDTLTTLPSEIFVDGCAEVIKYAVLFDQDLFDHLLSIGTDFDRESVIERCVQWKANTVCADEFDRGHRQLLNFGHTIGHGIEALSQYSVPHGQAVAIGMMLITRCALQARLCSEETCIMISKILHKFSLPTETSYTTQQIYEVALSDKKRAGDQVNLIVPEKIGQCRILHIHIDDTYSFLQAGL